MFCYCFIYLLIYLLLFFCSDKRFIFQSAWSFLQGHLGIRRLQRRRRVLDRPWEGWAPFQGLLWHDNLRRQVKDNDMIGQTFWNPRKECTKHRQLPGVASFLCVFPLNADKLHRNIVKVSVDPWGFVERENERQTEIKKKKNMWKTRLNLNFVSQNDSETPQDIDKH